MHTIFFEIIIIFALIILNGYFSMSEIALLSVKKNRLKYLSKQGNKKAKNALFLTRNSSDMLSTVQIGITTIGILAGAFSGVTIAEYLEVYLLRFSFISTYSGAISIIIVVIIITYFSLVVGELVPKQIALSNPEKRSLKVAGTIKIIMKFSTPLVALLSSSTKGLLKIFHISPATEQVITEEEIKLLIADGTKKGVFKRNEQKMVESIFHLGNRPIKDFMIPNKEVIWLDINDSIEQIKKKIIESDKSVFPICDGSIEKNLGIIEAKDILFYLFDDKFEKINLKSLIQPVISIDADVPSLVAIEQLKKTPTSIVFITEKKPNNIIGIISFYDILEEIVGEFQQK